VDPRVLDELRALLRDRTELGLVVLFGSCARGTEREASDLDVAILPTRDLSSVEEAELEAALERATHREIDLVRLDRTDDIVLRREIARGMPLREGRPGMYARFAASAALTAAGGRSRSLLRWADCVTQPA
jgi:uncharacterized protein